MTSCAAMVVSLTTAATASAATITLIDEQLNLQDIRLQSMDAQSITFFDAKGNYQTRSTTDFLQLRVTLDTMELKLFNQTQTGQASQPAQATQTTLPPSAANADEEEMIVPSISAGSAPSADENGVGTTEPASSVPAGWGVVQLIDGQRFSGRLIGSDDAGQVMQWEHPLAGLLTFKLDHVRHWQLTREDLPAPSQDGVDQLLLTNGDALPGFVSAVTATHISFTPQGTQQAVNIELPRVRAIILANAPLSEPSPAALVTLADGSRLRALRVVIEQGELRFDPTLRQSDERVTLGLAQLRELAFANPKWQLVKWTDLPRQTQGESKVFTTPWPVRQTDDQLQLHAPVTLSFTLPSGASALAATLSLDVAPTDPAIGWSDFVVRLTVDGSSPDVPQELGRLAMSEKNPAGRLHANQTTLRAGGDSKDSTSAPSSSAPRTLTLTLDPALNGPIMDRLKVSDAWVVVAKK